MIFRDDKTTYEAISDKIWSAITFGDPDALWRDPTDAWINTKDKKKSGWPTKKDVKQEKGYIPWDGITTYCHKEDLLCITTQEAVVMEAKIFNEAMKTLWGNVRIPSIEELKKGLHATEAIVKELATTQGVEKTVQQPLVKFMTDEGLKPDTEKQTAAVNTLVRQFERQFAGAIPQYLLLQPMEKLVYNRRLLLNPWHFWYGITGRFVDAYSLNGPDVGDDAGDELEKQENDDSAVKMAAEFLVNRINIAAGSRGKKN